MKKQDVVFFEAFEEEQRLLRKFCPKNIKAEFIPKTIQESGVQTPSSSLVSIRTQSSIPVSWGRDLRGILTRSTGFEHLLDYQAQSKTLAALGYLPSYCARAVAEQAFLLILSLSRKLKTQEKNFDTFCRDGLTGLECRDKNILVVGVGNIGSEMVDIAQGLRMNVAGVDIVKRLSALEYKDLNFGLAWADVVVCSCSLTSKTKGMLGYENLKGIKKGALFVNVARGEISPLKDLKRLLDENILGGIGLDVYENEQTLAPWFRSDKKAPATEATKIVLGLKKKDNVVFTPHNAFNTQEALERKAQQTIESAVSFLTKGTFIFPVPEK
ncbi:MAG: hydroxyacid dehydrogenase [Candidatus Omnitrophica bacterium]|nr:hydroxyacid dehydrogenase [Candidatus Omnitrophota bacterium]